MRVKATSGEALLASNLLRAVSANVHKLPAEEKATWPSFNRTVTSCYIH